MRSANYVDLHIGVRSLAELAGMRGAVSVRELITLLGQREYGPMPVYMIGHNTNSIAEVNDALAAGANAVEVDVTAYQSDLNQLCIDHAGLTGDAPGHAEAPRFKDFLRNLRVVVDEGPERLALVIFDCKPPAATPEHGPSIPITTVAWNAACVTSSYSQAPTSVNFIPSPSSETTAATPQTGI